MLGWLVMLLFLDTVVIWGFNCVACYLLIWLGVYVCFGSFGLQFVCGYYSGQVA